MRNVTGGHIGNSCRERYCFHQALGLHRSPAAARRTVVQRHHDISRLRRRARRERRQMGVAKHRYRGHVERTQSRALHHFDRRDLAVSSNNDVDFYVATLIGLRGGGGTSSVGAGVGGGISAC